MSTSEIRKGTRIVFTNDKGHKEHGVITSDKLCGPYYFVNLDNGHRALVHPKELELEDRSDD